jgi:hypothetical protein
MVGAGRCHVENVSLLFGFPDFFIKEWREEVRKGGKRGGLSLTVSRVFRVLFRSCPEIVSGSFRLYFVVVPGSFRVLNVPMQGSVSGLFRVRLGLTTKLASQAPRVGYRVNNVRFAKSGHEKHEEEFLTADDSDEHG